MLGETQIRSLLQRILRQSKADTTEVLFTGLEEALTRFANNEIHQNVAEANASVVIRTTVGRRLAEVSTSDLTEAGTERALEAATAMARLQPPDSNFPGFAPPAALPEAIASYDEATAEATPEMRARAVGEVIRYARERDVNASGAFSTARYEWAIANSHGLFVYQPTTLAEVVVVAMTDTSSGYGAATCWQMDRVSVFEEGRRAVEKALRAQDPRPLPAGDYPVLLEPHATGDLLTFLGRGASAMNVHEGRSWMAGRHGEALVSPQITIVDDPRDPFMWPLAFDFEGVARQPVALLAKGRVGEPVYDRGWAALAGRESTGHGIPSFNPFSPGQTVGNYGPLPLHTKMEAGEASVEEMIRQIDRGLYVTRFHYTREVHPRDVVVTGLTRDGTFWIEKGEIAYPVRNLRFTQSYIEALQHVVAVGKVQQTGRGWVELLRAPALSLGTFRFTGTTQF